MTTEIELNGVPIRFPFKPYDVQKDYMSKVIECLQEGKNGVLESPTGTGKTLSLLCSSLAWLMIKKAQLQVQAQQVSALDQVGSGHDFGSQFTMGLNKGGGKVLGLMQNSFAFTAPKIIYASRTHSQLSQAMQELKRTSYNHVYVAVLGSRDQLCIHPEVAKEQSSATKIHMCQAKVKARTCYFYNNVETRKDDPNIRQNILDIEDLVKAGQKFKCCPYFLAKELKQNSDIIFMPYNYLLDPKTRKAQGVELQNNIILLDEAHNVEKMCEEAASLQISSTDIAVCIDEITAVMKDLSKEMGEDFSNEIAPGQNDFSAEDLCILKAMFLELEKAIDSIEIKKRDEGDTYPGSYIFELLSKADISQGKEQLVTDKLDKIILYLTTVSTSPFNKKGNALQKFSDLLKVVFSGSNSVSYKERVKKCYKVYIQPEQPKKSFKNDAWETKKLTKSDGKLISYWCFSPGFGMQQLIDHGARSIILTSGTLSPLKPFISEIGIDISVQLENPHIVTEKQICVGVVSNGCDGHMLNSSYNTRNDPKYITSLGQSIKVLSCVLPHGLLVFFPSYPIMRKCQDDWQKAGIWTQIENRKPIFVEPQSKDGFNSIMTEYYKKVQDPAHHGAIFMAVCRGKVSEGLDFANANGRAVIITGLPFPPLKDPRVILKQRYLDENKSAGKESLTGQQWYQLEASRAVNQAIGRIIRHKNDYGAILLCDIRFENQSFKQQLSAWLRPHIKKFDSFRLTLKELREFFKFAHTSLPQPRPSISELPEVAMSAVPAKFDTSGTRKVKITPKVETADSERSSDDFDLSSYKTQNDSQVESNSNGKKPSAGGFASMFDEKPKTLINLQTCKMSASTSLFQESALLASTSERVEPVAKKRKLKVKPLYFSIESPSVSSLFSCKNSSAESPEQRPTNNGNDSASKEKGKTYLKQVKDSLSQEKYKTFKEMVSTYSRGESDYDQLINTLTELFIVDQDLKHLFIGFKTFVKKIHVESFDKNIKEVENFSII
ncbi:hypothetical protein QAD02_011140 [Eretmocerus hayati]|uniref:Uncharacterized protein n=1 Tax=Eretmocerus hayati TaxID=131215 RepID=A0ACC2NVR6_9HYME|nr:hypothetical protein QAD02_011140 [Eretmocerus hayati]